MVENETPKTQKAKRTRKDGAARSPASAGRKVESAPPGSPENLTESIVILLELLRTVQGKLEKDMQLSDLLKLAETQGRNSARLAELLLAQAKLQPKDDFAQLLNKNIQEVLEEQRKK
jgi:hypothetical protein